MTNITRGYQNNKIDIVIVTYKAYEYLERCITSIYDDSSSRGFIQDIVVVDNAPSLAYWNSAPKLFDNLTIIRSDKNLGFARAVNLGIRKCHAPYIMLLNPDTTIHRDMIGWSVDFMEQHPTVGVMGPKIINEDGSIQGSARGFPNYSTLLFGRVSPLNRIFPNNRWTRRNIPCFCRLDDEVGSYRVDWVSGAAAVIRRNAIEDVGYFDERFFMYWEDADLCQRMRRAGWQVIYYPVPRVTHLVGRSSRHHPWRRELNFHKSAFLLARKQDHGSVPWRSLLVAYALGLHMLFRLTTAPLTRP